MGGTAQRRKNRLRAQKILEAPTRHDGEGAGLCAHRAARDGCVKVRQTQLAQSGRMITGLAGLNRCHVDKKGAFTHGMRCTQIKQHLSHHRAVLQQADHDIGRCHGIGGGVMDRNAIAGKRLGFGAGAVPCMHLVASGAQTARHGQAHHANAENGDAKRGMGHGVTLIGLVLRLVFIIMGAFGTTVCQGACSIG
ncbi:hypothetical protein D3C71_1142600 [compost metagenome]